MQRLHSYTSKQKGLSLIELVVSILILSIIVMVVAQFVKAGTESYRATKDNISALSKIRLIDERLSKEVRRTRFNAAYDVNVFTGTSYEFIDIDGVTVGYGFAGSTLSITYDTPTVTSELSNQLTAFNFNYYASDGVSTALAVSEIKFVEWVMTLSDNGISYSLTNRVMLRGMP